MDMITSLEDHRLILQGDLDSAKTAKERNKLGQFSTPTSLASDVLRCARELMSEDISIRFLDPAVGTGSFYSALLQQFPDEKIGAATGFEIDPHYGIPARKLWRGHKLKINIADFTTATPPSEGAGYNLLICNPPYVRHHHLDKKTKDRLLVATAAASDMQMPGLAGLYCYFLGLSHAWMAAGGLAAWLIPSEFMDVNYGVSVKRYLLKQVELIRIHRFDPSELQFGDALVSSAVVWFRKRKPSVTQQVEFSYGGTLAKPNVSRMVSAASLRDTAKWTSLAIDGVRALSSGRRLADFFEIKRGLATGDNSFFILTREQIAAHELPIEFFKPILPGPRYLDSDIVETEADGTPKVSRQLFMLDCRLPETEVEAKYPSLWKYLQTGLKKAAETYICSHRTLWYSQENRPPAPFICTYMGRNLAKREKPFRFILNRSQATAANVYLLLYPKQILAAALAKNPGLDEKIWKFLTSIDIATLLGEGRVYGGGLYKMEPKELANVPAEEIIALLPGTSICASQIEMF